MNVSKKTTMVKTTTVTMTEDDRVQLVKDMNEVILRASASHTTDSDATGFTKRLQAFVGKLVKA